MTVISSAYKAICMLSGGCGMSFMNGLKSVGEMIEPCGTPLGKYRVRDELLLKITNDCMHDSS